MDEVIVTGRNAFHCYCGYEVVIDDISPSMTGAEYSKAMLIPAIAHLKDCKDRRARKDLKRYTAALKRIEKFIASPAHARLKPI